VSSGGDKTLFYWDVSTGQTVRRIAAHNGKIPAVSLNEDASVVVSGECEDDLRFFFVSSDHVLHTGSFDTNVKIWDLK
jgi:mitogen-activated protein kinase organizer 1